MHNNPTDVLQHIQKECVPSDLGGSDKSIKELGGEYIIFNFILRLIIYYW